jgi:HEAT repeat protein
MDTPFAGAHHESSMQQLTRWLFGWSVLALLGTGCRAQPAEQAAARHEPRPPDSFVITDLLPKERFLISAGTRAFVEANPADPKLVRLIQQGAGCRIEIVVHVFGDQISSLVFAEDADITSDPLRAIKTQDGKIVLGGDQQLIFQDWFDGTEHIFRGDVRIGPYRFESDPGFPLTFQVVKDSGYVYLCGRGTVSREGGPVVKLGQTQAASDWLGPLASGTVLQKQGAAEALGWYGDKAAVPALMSAVKDTSDWRVRRDAAEALGRIGDPSAESVLATAIADENPLVGVVAMESLAKIGRPGLPHLEKYLSGEKKKRDAAIYALGASPCAEAIDLLAKVVRDKNSDGVRMAVRSLGHIGKPECVPVLLEALQSEGNDVRSAAVDALAATKDPRSLEAILTALADKTPDVRKRAIAALAVSREPRALAALEEAAKKDADAEVRTAAEKALAPPKP